MAKKINEYIMKINDIRKGVILKISILIINMWKDCKGYISRYVILLFGCFASLKSESNSTYFITHGHTYCTPSYLQCLIER